MLRASQVKFNQSIFNNIYKTMMSINKRIILFWILSVLYLPIAVGDNFPDGTKIPEWFRVTKK